MNPNDYRGKAHKISHALHVDTILASNDFNRQDSDRIYIAILLFSPIQATGFGFASILVIQRPSGEFQRGL